MIVTYQQAFDLYLRRHTDIENYLLGRTRDPEATAEICRQVMEKIVRSCCDGRTVDNEGGWVRTIARNAASDYFKGLNSQRRVVENSTYLATPTTTNPYSQIEKFLRPLVGFLPAKYAEPLRLDLFDRLPQKDIAKRLGLGVSATKSRIQRARRLLRQEIETCFELEAGSNGRGLSDIRLRDSCTPLKNFEKTLPGDASFTDR